MTRAGEDAPEDDVQSHRTTLAELRTPLPPNLLERVQRRAGTSAVQDGGDGGNDG